MSCNCGCGHAHHNPAVAGPGEVALNGQLICADMTQLMQVLTHIEDHITLTRAEPGCLSFDVLQSDDPMIWTVAERFRDAAAFKAHQTRTKSSAWAQATGPIERRYQVTGLDD